MTQLKSRSPWREGGAGEEHRVPERTPGLPQPAFPARPPLRPCPWTPAERADFGPLTPQAEGKRSVSQA